MFSRYFTLSVLVSRLDLSRSRDTIGHVTIRFPMGHFLLVSLEMESLGLPPAVLWHRALSILGSRVWPFGGGTWRHRSHYRLITHTFSYWWSFGTKARSLTVYEIFNGDC